jgi:phosphoribosyl-ATP pyrophosphohydrolase/phosphoribosyl-AMP cyclohydrolase
MSDNALVFLTSLEDIIADRAGADADSSYTARLLAEGTRRVAQKVGEEGVEVALAAAAGNRDELLDEAADLLYHLLVLLRDQDVSLADVVTVLEERHRPG